MRRFSEEMDGLFEDFGFGSRGLRRASQKTLPRFRSSMRPEPVDGIV
jgi:hypothetical protein